MAKIKFTKEQYATIWEVCSRKEQYGGWEDVAKVLNDRFGTNYGESAFRKIYQMYNYMDSAVKEKYGSGNDLAREFELQKRELECEKIKFRDERNAWNKQNYTAARTHHTLDYLEETFKQSSPVTLDIKMRHGSSNETGIICLSDLHIGECYDNEYGCYNSDVAKQRLANYASKCLQILAMREINNVIILGLGDMISGSIWRSIQVTNRENVIEQLELASEYVAGFVDAFVRNGFVTTFVNVAGNHSRLCGKDEAVKDERLDDIVGWYVGTQFSRYPHFRYIKSGDNTLAEFEVCGNKYLACHGDYDNFSKSGLANLVLLKGYKPKAVFFGHYHTFAVDDQYNVKLIRSGCLGGSGNDYTQTKRLTGNPSQTMVIADENGVNEFYNFDLKEKCNESGQNGSKNS